MALVMRSDKIHFYITDSSIFGTSMDTIFFLIIMRKRIQAILEHFYFFL